MTEFNINRTIWGIPANQRFSTVLRTPLYGEIVCVELESGVDLIAIHRGKAVELPNGTFTWLYKFLGVALDPVKMTPYREPKPAEPPPHFPIDQPKRKRRARKPRTAA
jgi:hypothetical protein